MYVSWHINSLPSRLYLRIYSITNLTFATCISYLTWSRLQWLLLTVNTFRRCTLMKMMNFLGNIFFLSNSSVFHITTSSGGPVVKSLIRELKQRRRRRKRKRHLKSKFALPQFLSRLFHLV